MFQPSNLVIIEWGSKRDMTSWSLYCKISHRIQCLAVRKPWWGEPDNFFTLLAMQSQFERMNVVFNEIKDVMERHSQQSWGKNSSNHTRRTENHFRPPQQSNIEESHEEDDRVGSTRSRRREGRRERRDINISSIKMTIPPFKGRNDAKAYLKCERKV